MSAGTRSNWTRMCRNSASIAAAIVAAAGLAAAASTAFQPDHVRPALGLQQDELAVTKNDFAWG